MTPILSVRQLVKDYEIRRFLKAPRLHRAVNDVSFELKSGETLALVGESGCGKTTIAKMLLGIEQPTSGEILFSGQRLDPKKNVNIQMIFQDPYGSLNPRKRAWEIIGEPLMIHTRKSKDEIRDEAVALMKRVGLRPEFQGRYPHQFSGGQRQRIGIARALILNPKVIICDEPVSALDVSIQAQVLNLLLDLQDERGLSYLFISHDLGVVRYLADRVMVMNQGRIVEHGQAEQIFESPQHDYTRLLLSSVFE